MPAAIPLTPSDLGRYSQRARARVFWGDRQSEIVHSLERKGVRRKQAAGIVDEAVTERSVLLLREGLFNLLPAALLFAAAAVAHSPGILNGEPWRPFDLQNLSVWATPFFCVGVVFAARAAQRLVRGAFRLE